MDSCSPLVPAGQHCPGPPGCLCREGAQLGNAWPGQLGGWLSFQSQHSPALVVVLSFRRHALSNSGMGVLCAPAYPDNAGTARGVARASYANAPTLESGGGDCPAVTHPGHPHRLGRRPQPSRPAGPQVGRLKNDRAAGCASLYPHPAAPAGDEAGQDH
jgi:hypothetical protein